MKATTGTTRSSLSKIRHMEREGGSQLSIRQWVLPVALVSKVCIDYTLDTIPASKWFSNLCRLKGWLLQIGMELNCKAKTAFTICSGLWLFT